MKTPNMHIATNKKDTRVWARRKTSSKNKSIHTHIRKNENNTVCSPLKQRICWKNKKTNPAMVFLPTKVRCQVAHVLVKKLLARCCYIPRKEKLQKYRAQKAQKRTGFPLKVNVKTEESDSGVWEACAAFTQIVNDKGEREWEWEWEPERGEGRPCVLFSLLLWKKSLLFDLAKDALFIPSFV